MAALDEAARQYYLGQAGIQLWYARAPLPGAAPSPDFDFSEPEVVRPQVTADVAAPGELNAAERAGRMARIQGLMAGKEAASSVVAAKVPAAIADTNVSEPTPPPPDTPVIAVPQPPVDAEPEAETAPAVGAKPLEAHWGIWFGSRVMLVSTISDDASYQLQEALARNILKAVNENNVSGFRVQWPVFNNPLVPGNDRDGFTRVVADRCRECQGREVVLLGVLADVSGEERAGLLQALPGQPSVDFETTLAALSTDPGAKRRLWHELRQCLGSVR